LRDPVAQITLGVVILAFWGLLHRNALRDAATASWDIPVSGRVVDVQTRAHQNRGHVQLWFEYTAPDGRPGQGVWRLAGERTGPQEALAFRSSYAVGTRVSGWANPQNPTEAVVERGRAFRWTWFWAGVPAAGGVLVLWGGVGVSRGVARRRAARAASQAAFDEMMGEIRRHKVGRRRGRGRFGGR
jgi:hypothetical protein